MSLREKIERILMLACVDGKRREMALEGILQAVLDAMPEEKKESTCSSCRIKGFNECLTEVKKRVGCGK